MRVVLPPQQDAEFFFRLGLDIAGFTGHRLTCYNTNIRRYKAEYGSAPRVHAKMFSDLKKSRQDAGPNSTLGIAPDSNPSHLLWACHWLHNYHKLVSLSGQYKKSEVTISKWLWFYVRKLNEILPQKIKWKWRINPDNPEEIIIASVDGVHCRINEPGGFDRRYRSHKLGKASFNYEVACAIREPAIVHICGPTFQQNDGTVSQRPDGIQAKVPPGRKIIADKMYAGYGDCFMTPHPRDKKRLRKFKNRARARQETINARLKEFRVLAEVYRHRRGLHGLVFCAVCVIVQYEMEMGEPIFDI